MQKEYVIDGNNLIGKMSDLKSVQKSNPQKAREQLIPRLNRYFLQKRCKVQVFFDGFEKDKIVSGDIRIHYSNKSDADTMIKQYIDNSRNPKHLVVISSDNSVSGYARQNACEIISAEEFIRNMANTVSIGLDAVEEKPGLAMENDYFIKLFNAK